MSKPSQGIQKKNPPAEIKDKAKLTKDKALDEALDEFMDASDPPSITQPGKKFVGPED